MTEPDARLGAALRATITERVSHLDPPAGDVYQQVRRRHRRSRRRTVAVAALVTALTAVGVPLAVTGDRTGPPPPATAPVRPETRGSLAGDRAAIEDAVRLLTRQAGPYRVDPASIRVPYAEQHDGYRVVLAVGTAPADGGVVAVFATAAPGQPLRPGSSLGGPAQPGVDARAGRQFAAPEHVLTRLTIGDRSFGLALFPAGSRATIRRGSAVGADCRRSETGPVPLPMHRGGVLFPIAAGDAPWVDVVDDRTGVLIARALEPDRPGPAGPSESEVATQLAATLRGDAGPGLVAELAGYAVTGSVRTGVGERPWRWVGLWAGQLPGGGGVAALFGARYASGATVVQGLSTDPGGTGYRSWLTGCVPARQLGHGVMVERLADQPGRPLVIVAPAPAVRATIWFADGASTSVPLVEGGGFHRGGGTVTHVVAFDAAGGSTGSGAPGVNYLRLPLER